MSLSETHWSEQCTQSGIMEVGQLQQAPLMAYRVLPTYKQSH